MNLLVEQTDGLDIDMMPYVDELENLIHDFLFAPNSIKYLQSVSADEEVSAVLDAGHIFSDHPNVNELHLTLMINDDSAASIDAMYACDVEDRSQSNLLLMVDLPREYSEIPELHGWLSAELGDALSHELQHSCDATEMLAGDCPEGAEKWQSTELIGKYYGCEAEVRGHVAGILGRARRTGQNPYGLLDDDMGTILAKAVDRGYTEKEMRPVLQQIYGKWLARLEVLL